MSAYDDVPDDEHPPWVVHAREAIEAQLAGDQDGVEAAVMALAPEDVPGAVLVWIDLTLEANGIEHMDRRHRHRPLQFRSSDTGTAIPRPELSPAARMVGRMLSARAGDDEEAFRILLGEASESADTWTEVVYTALHIAGESIEQQHRHEHTEGES